MLEVILGRPWEAPKRIGLVCPVHVTEGAGISVRVMLRSLVVLYDCCKAHWVGIFEFQFPCFNLDRTPKYSLS